MSVTPLYVGDVGQLRKLFNILKERGFKVIAPKLVDGIIRLTEVRDFSEIPEGVEDFQGPGRYEVREGEFFRHGPDSPKKYLFPPELRLFKVTPDWRFELGDGGDVKLAFFGIKPCDLAAIKVMDLVQGSYGDPHYFRVRGNSLVVVENCVKPGGTCFCATMGTGPKASGGFDISFTKLGSKVFFEAGSERGVELLGELELRPAEGGEVREVTEVLSRAAEQARAGFDLREVPELLEAGLESPVFKEITERCLGCANCTMVCPTCFCFDVIDVPNLDGSAERIRVWDSCFTFTYAQVAGGHFREELWARYRHWLLHKFSYWLKQFGTFGCVGCGRCITWCPTGIDVRESVIKVIKWVRSGGGS